MLSEFMIKVLARADTLIYHERGCSLCDIYGMRSTILKMLVGVLEKGWAAFKSLALLVKLPYTSYLENSKIWDFSRYDNAGFTMWSWWNKEDCIKLLYENRKFIAAVECVGDNYHLKLQTVEDIENLIDAAATDLLNFRM